MKKIVSAFLIISLSFSLLVATSNNVCYALAGPEYDEIVGGEYLSPTLIKSQYSKATVSCYESYNEWGLMYHVEGLFSFIPEESGEYTITLSKSIDDQSSYGFNVFVKENGTSDVLFEGMQNQNYTVTIDVVAGKSYDLNVFESMSTVDRIVNIVFDKPLSTPKTATIDPIDDISINSLEASLPRATVRENGEIVTGKKVIYSCETLTGGYGGRISSTDRYISIGSETPNGTYTVTVSLEDNSAEPVTFDININISKPTTIVLSPQYVELVKDGTDSDFFVNLPNTTVYDSENNQLEVECVPTDSNIEEAYLRGEPSETVLQLSKDIPLGTYYVTYGDDSLMNNFEIIVRNPRIEYNTTTGGEITGDIIQTVEPGASGAEVTAVPEEGYEFVKWSDGVTTTSRRDENINADLTVTAEFIVSGPEILAPIAGFGNALSLNGTNQYIQINDESDLILNNTFTQEFWIVPNINDTATYRSIIGGQIDSVHDRAPSIYLYKGTGIHAGFGAKTSDGSGAWTAFHVSDVLIADTWNHVALTCDGKYYRVYVNGTFINAIDFNDKYPIETPLQYLGKLDNYFWGELDEVRIWDTDLTQEEIYDWMNKEIDSTHPKYNDLMAYWQFNNPNKVVDQVSNLESIMINLVDYNKPAQVPLRFFVEPDSSVEISKMYYNPSQLSIETVIASEPQHGTLTEFQDHWIYTPNENAVPHTIDYFEYFVHETGADTSDLSLFNIVRVYLNIQETTYYTVDFKYSDNTSIQSQQIKKGSLIQDFVPSLAGHTFVGWTKSIDDKAIFDLSTNIMNDLILYPIWIPTEYTVTFEDYDGVILKTETVNHGLAATAPDNPSRVGHTFLNWSVPYNNVTSNLTVRAVYDAITHQVRYIDHDGTVISIQSVEEGQSATSPANPTREGYTFTEWDPVDFSNITSAIDITAQYDINQYTVTFESNGGSAIDPITADFDLFITEPATPTKTGYNFLGWYKELGLTTKWNFTSDKVPAENITLYGKWSRVSDGGSSGGSSSNDTSDSSKDVEDSKKQEENTIIIVNGQEEKAGKESITVESGEKVVEIKVDSEIINKRIEEVIKNQSQEINSIEVPISTQDAKKITTTLTGDIVKTMDENDFNLSITSEEINYVIPAKEVGIESVAQNLGVEADKLKEIEIEVKISKADENITKEIEERAKANGHEIVFPPVSFEVIAKTKTKTGDEKQVTVSKFNQYVQRVMKLPEGVDTRNITTGVVYNEDGTFSHVPTSVFMKDGIYYAKINSLTNSSYSAIWNPIVVESVENHWSREAVNDMASRLVIKNPEMFMPDQNITRGELAEYITKALGIYRTGVTKTQKFSDAEIAYEFADAIEIASDYGIISGYPEGSFIPSAIISREEAMMMYSRAMDIAGLKEVEDDRIESYSDRELVADWAYNDVKKTVSSGVFYGKTKDTINPKDTFTCGEAAAAIRNLLVASGLINE